MTVPTTAGGQVFQFRYFMLRLRIRDEPAEMTPRLTGVVERLGSGERRDFSSSEELVKVMEAWDADFAASRNNRRGP
jgi:cytochrome c2